MMNTTGQDVWETKNFLIHCAEIHPRAQIQDFIKRIHQSEFGSDCEEESKEKFFLNLQRDICCMTEKMRRRAWFDPFCSEFCRLNLSVASEISPELISRIFWVSKQKSKRAAAWFRFEEKLSIFWALFQEQPDLFRFTKEEMIAYLKEYQRQGYPRVRHSELYQKLYEPCYRVVLKEYARNVELYSAIERCLREKGTVNVAIDGNCGAGKTRLSRVLSDLWDCNVFHTDDFFLPLSMRTPERLSEVGGNMERERFREEICEQVKTGKPFSYRPFNCSDMTLGDPVQVTPKQVNIFEGAYCMHPELRDYYDVTVFLGLNPAAQEARILERNGSFMLRKFLDEWIPKENAYFEQMKVKEACQIIYEV